MNKYEETRSVHDEHRSFCSDWKLSGGNDFVDEALSLADDQVDARRRHGKGFRPSHAKIKEMTQDFLEAGGHIKVVAEAIDAIIDLNEVENTEKDAIMDILTGG